MKHLLTLLLVFSIVFACQSQVIEKKQTFGGYKYSQSGKAISIKDLLFITRDDPEIYELVRSAKSNHATASVVSAFGGAFIGWPLGTSLGGGDPIWSLAAVGGSLLALAFIIDGSAYNKINLAIDSYNQSISYRIPRKNTIEFSIGTSASGFGIVCNF